MNVKVEKFHSMKSILTGYKSIDIFKVYENQLAQEYYVLWNSYGFLTNLERASRITCRSATILEQI